MQNFDELQNKLNDTEIDTDNADISTTETLAVDDDNLEDNMLSNFEDSEEMDLTSEKIKEINKSLPSWSLEPPHSFIK